jgi:hypothetical protein
MSEQIEHEKHQIAIQVSVLSYDLTRRNPIVPTLMKENTLEMLVAQRDELLAGIDEAVSLRGFYLVPEWLCATWLATLLQTELGSYVADGEYEGHKAILATIPG